MKKEEKVEAKALDTHSRAQLPLGLQGRRQPNEPHLIKETIGWLAKTRADCLAMSATELICKTSTLWPLEIMAPHHNLASVDMTLLGMPFASSLFAKYFASTIVGAIQMIGCCVAWPAPSTAKHCPVSLFHLAPQPMSPLPVASTCISVCIYFIYPLALQLITEFTSSIRVRGPHLLHFCRTKQVCNATVYWHFVCFQ